MTIFLYFQLNFILKILSKTYFPEMKILFFFFFDNEIINNAQTNLYIFCAWKTCCPYNSFYVNSFLKLPSICEIKKIYVSSEQNMNIHKNNINNAHRYSWILKELSFYTSFFFYGSIARINFKCEEVVLSCHLQLAYAYKFGMTLNYDKSKIRLNIS